MNMEPLNQNKEESAEWGNDQRNDFIINLHKKYVADLGFSLTTPISASG